MGMWLIQECRKYYIGQGLDYSFEDLINAALKAEPFKNMINPNDERFFSPGEMPQKITDYCLEKGQIRPDNPGEITRCIVESLALQYRLVIEELESAVAKTYKKINIVGGGSSNKLLNQCVANATGKEVYAGPVEATAIGNLLVQLISLTKLPPLLKDGKWFKTHFH